MMFDNMFLRALGTAFRFYAAVALAVLLFQLVGLAVYYIDVWPGTRENLAAGVTSFVSLAVILILVRSCLWIWIYRHGARVFFLLHREGDSPTLPDHLAPPLKALTRLLVVSCILDICFLPVIFLSDRLLPFPLSGLWLGLVDLAILLLPQSFGIGALILAFLTHKYGQILQERSQMKEEIALTI
jgi:hypothetical protein